MLVFHRTMLPVVETANEVAAAAALLTDLERQWGLIVGSLQLIIYARGRLAIEATAAKVQPVGIRYPLGTQPRLLAAAEIYTLANEARNPGMKGVICPHPSWVEPVNRAFTPTADLVAYNQRVRTVFAEAVASGTAAVPLDGRMIDVPVDEWAKVVIAMHEACSKHDAEKQAALERLR